MALVKRRPMDAAKTNISTFPSLENIADEAERKRNKWWLPITHAIGITMANEQKPNGWSWNPATITLALGLAGTIALGGYYVGQKDTEYKMLMEKVNSAEKKAEAADTKATYAVRGTDNETGHTKPNANANGQTKK